MNHDTDYKSYDGDRMGLPLPAAAAQAHSARLQRLIAEEMADNGGRLSFARFMELALYAPGLGYYSGGSLKLGAEGDFMTAPEWSSLFSRCLARQVAQVLVALGGGDVLEVGGGSGVMAADILESLLADDCLPRHYYILELSADLRDRQQTLLKNRLPHIQDRIIWLERLPEPGFRGVIVANELLDALPVHCFTIAEAGAAELYVERRDEQWSWCQGEPSSAELSERIAGLQQAENLPVGYISEINLAAEAWVVSMADILTAGVLLLIDYGFPRREYYHPERNRGTLMCHYRHRAHANPFILVGLQDITAHVEFTALAEAAYAAGMKVAGYTTQAAFLLAQGITEFMSEADDELKRLRWAQQIKKLTMPHEMGDLFKVLALTRDVDEPLQGFGLRDMRNHL
jgi:SAM-dependent MidA family methyltransferase